MKHGSLFSGIGGFDLAAEWMGWENEFHCEWNEFGQQVLQYYWPKAKSYADITKTDFTIHRGRIDILTGGFPCQPYSQAGKRLGKEDDRHLWPEMLRAIREIQPRWIVGENVLGIVNWNGGVVFEEVQTDLESEGYEVQPFILPAAGVGAPHQRYRVWFVAYSIDNGYKTRRKKVSKENGIQREYGSKMGSRKFNGADFSRPQQREVSYKEQRESGGNSCTMGNRLTPDTDSKRSEKLNNAKEPKQKRRIDRLSPSHERWAKFPTEPPVCRGNDGFPIDLDRITFPKWRNESIKAYGNAIVPQVVYQIFKSIENYEKHY